MNSPIGMGNREPIVSWVTKWHTGKHPDTPTTGVEIGVYRGEVSALLLKAVPQLSLYMVDPWRVAETDSDYLKTQDPTALQNADEHINNYLTALHVTELAARRRTVLRLKSQTAFERLGGRLFEFVFIDGDHSESAVQWDVENWWQKVRSGGMLLGHDYGEPQYPWIKPIVDEFAARNGLQLAVDGECWRIDKP